MGDGPARLMRASLIEDRRVKTMKTQQEAKTAPKRRDFLRLAGLGTAAGAAAAVGATAAEAGVEATEQGAGYRETAHVKKVYELARF